MSFSAILERLQTLENPYPGLRPFERTEQHLFFGRDQQIAELVARLGKNRFVAVVGVSGSGKSSLVRAGLIPALERGSVGEAAARWRMVVSRPAGRPFESLAAELHNSGLDPSSLRNSSYGLLHVARQLPADETLLVVIDQFEELFRYKDRELITKEDSLARETASSEAAEFVQLLLAASRHLPAVYVVLTMRSDYLGDCAEFTDLPEALNVCQYLIPRLTREQRKEAIEGPLGRTAISPSLVQRILNDAGDEPNQLPVLQHALMRTWGQWRRSDPNGERGIRLEDYEAPSVGGLEHALDRHAEELLRDSPEDIAIAETIFKRLTTGTRREHRTPSRLDELWELCGADSDATREKVNGFIDRFRIGEATFLTPRDGTLSGETYIDITHESLIREWGRLRAWVAEEADSRTTFLRIYDDAQLCAQKKADLWRDPKLQMALDWWQTKKPTAAWARPFLSDGTGGDAAFELTRDFLERSRRAREEEVAIARRRRRSVQITTVAVIAILAGLLVWGLISRIRMKAEHQLAVARALAWESLNDQDEQPEQIERSTLYAIESVKREATSANLHTLQQGALLLQKDTLRLSVTGNVWAVSFGPDGNFAVANEHKGATVYDAKGDKMVDLADGMPVWTVAFSKDGQFLATGGQGGAKIFSTKTWKPVWWSTKSDYVDIVAVSFNPDATHLAMTSLQGKLFLIDGKTGKEIKHPEYANAVHAVAFSPDGRYLAVGDENGTVRVAEARNPQKSVWEIPLKHAVRSLSFSPDGRYLAVGSDESVARVYDVQSRNQYREWPHKGAVIAVSFSPDGRYLATGSGDSVVRVFDTSDERELLRQVHQGQVLSVAFSRDGNVLASGGVDGVLDITQMAFPEKITDVHLWSGFPSSQIATTWDARYLAAVDSSGTAQVFALPQGKATSPLMLMVQANQVAVSSGGRYVVLGGPGGASVFEASTGKVNFQVPRSSGTLSLDITPDGRYVAVATMNDSGKNSEVRLFDVQNGRKVWDKSDFERPISIVAFSADGRFLAVGGEESHLTILHTDTGAQQVSVPFDWHDKDRAPTEQASKAKSIIFSKDGKYVVLAGNDKAVRIMDIANDRVSKEIRVPAEIVYAVLSDDDQFLATSSEDLTGRVYDVGTSKELWHMPVPRNSYFPLTFMSENKYLLLAAGDQDISIERYMWRPQDLIDNACSLLGRNLTAEEWGRLFKEPRPRTCPNLP